jgi:TRAP-type mannitol/chloroaromatic compound transport system permease small subunit
MDKLDIPHFPLLRRFAAFLERIVATVGKITLCFLLLMVLCEFAIVIMRYVFNYGSIVYQEAIFYMHGFVIMLSSAYTLQKDGHVRVDVLYSHASPKTKALIDLFGALIFLMPFTLFLAFYSLPYALESIIILEGSADVGGIQGVYLLKSAIVLFCFLFFIQGTALAIHALISLLSEHKNLAKTHSA